MPNVLLICLSSSATAHSFSVSGRLVFGVDSVDDGPILECGDFMDRGELRFRGDLRGLLYFLHRMVFILSSNSRSFFIIVMYSESLLWRSKL